MRYLGIDFGSKRVGLALSDEEGTMGFPHSVAINASRLMVDICSLIKKERVEAVVIGESRNLAGGENPIAKEARQFGDVLKECSAVPVFYESEVFTSEEARQAPMPAGSEADSGVKKRKSRAPKKHQTIDASAAALILTSYLSRMNHG